MEHSERPLRRSRAWLIALAVFVLLLLVLLAPEPTAPYLSAAISLILAAAIGVTMWAVLRTRADHRAYEAQLTEWAAEKAVHAERLRIARDLHDLASHGLGLMTVRAATANLTDEHDEAERRQAFTDIERIWRETTTELRTMLTVLRTASDSPAPLRPAHSLADLPRIIETAQSAGLTVTVEHGDLGKVSPGVQLTICSVVREALANTLRHAGRTHSEILLHRDDTGIIVDVRDAGRAPGWSVDQGTGNGLRGLRERVAVHGGTLAHGLTGRGFLLLAHIADEVV